MFSVACSIPYQCHHMFFGLHIYLTGGHRENYTDNSTAPSAGTQNYHSLIKYVQYMCIAHQKNDFV